MTASQGEIHDPALIAQRPLITQSYLTPHAIEWLMICLAHDRQLFNEARSLIADHHFKPQETPLRIVYEALCISIERYSGVTYETLASIVSERLANTQGFILTEQQEQIIFRRDDQGLLWQICNPDPGMLNTTNKALARDLLRRFAYERTVVEPLRHVMNPGFNEGVPENLGDFLSVINTQHARISTLSSIPETILTPALWSPLVSANEFRLTGVPFIDAVLGGQRVGDCNGLIGPTGGGKTTLAVHMAVANAKQSWLEAQMTGTEPGLVVFITAEESGLKLRPRIWSAFFNIPKRKLDIFNDWNTFTKPGQLDPYEVQLQLNQQYKLSELERYVAYAPQLESCMRVLDLSGSDEFPNAGFGYIEEIVSYLSRYQQKIRTVYIDYAGIFCERYMTANNMDEKNYRYLLKTFGDRCRQEISVRFGATTWVLHQLKGSMGKSSPTKLMHHSDAGESADFANNMVVVGCLGIGDPYTGCRRLNWSKCRYMASDKLTAPTLRINDNFAIMEDVSQLFVVGEGGNFMTPEDRNQIRGTETLARHVPVGGPPGLRTNPRPLIEL